MNPAKQYVIREDTPASERKYLSEHPELVQHLLFHRGIRTAEEAKEFLNPDYETQMHDPFLYLGMDKAVERVVQAVRKNEKVIIFSDYDADGIPGAVALHDFFKKIGFTNFENYIPHRHDEGFGLNEDAVREFGEKKAKLLITIDCGIADGKEIEAAKKFGMDVIVTDHHLPREISGKESLPDALSVIDAKQKACEYPDKNLSGAGVIYKLIQAIIRRDDFGLKPGWEKWLLDMIGISTLSDMVPLVGENRVLASFGLKVLRKSPRPGLMKLLRKMGTDQRHLSEDDIVFSLTPKLNAASRMGEPEDAFDLLRATDEVEADRLSAHLLKINDERKGAVGSIAKQVKKIIAERYQGDKKIIVMGNPDWRPSLLGLVANSLSKEYSCPVFLWGRDGEGEIKGSCRSNGSVNLVALMEGAKDSFSEFGGHAMSGGFSVTTEKIHGLEQELLSAYKKAREDGFEQKFFIDKKISIDDVNWNTENLIAKLSPFGTGNEKPIFLIEDVLVRGKREFGKEGNHLELKLERRDGSAVPAISFFAADNGFKKIPEAGERTNILATLEKSMFRNFPELRLRIVDFL